MKNKLKSILIALSIILLSLIVFSNVVKIETDYYYCESPTVRWKLAIYCGECDAETGCHFVKLKGTGPLEYFGLREIDCERN